jgi:serine-type D-Ala-D-Ala carboxypeptidase/endopeptidase (penicillin-binding protein 4)
VPRSPRAVVWTGTTLLLAGTLAATAAAAPVGPYFERFSRTPAQADAQQSQARPQAPREAIDTALQSRIAQRMSRATADHYGFVVDIQGVGRVVSLGPGRAMRPASTQKLFTTLPLLLDNSDRRLVTDVVVTKPPVDGVVAGDLVIRASGDPSLVKGNLVSLARAVHRAGVTRVTGRLVLDIGSLPTNTRQPGWKHEFVPEDIGPLSPFPLDRDWWRTDSSYISNPTRANLDFLRQRLAHNHVKVVGNDLIVRSSTASVVLASHQSATMRALITQTLRWSDNFYAESLLSVLGGHAPVNRTTSTAGVTDTSRATDGSGLSYADRETVRGEVTLLDYAHGSPAAGDLLHALPVACRSGTLRHRFCRTAGGHNVFAKTGTLTHSSALAGYSRDARGRWVTFAVITGGVRNTYAAEKAIDRAVLVIRNYQGS